MVDKASRHCAAVIYQVVCEQTDYQISAQMSSGAVCGVEPCRGAIKECTCGVPIRVTEPRPTATSDPRSYLSRHNAPRFQSSYVQWFGIEER